MKRKVWWALLIGLVAMVVAFLPRDYYFDKCIQIDRLNLEKHPILSVVSECGAHWVWAWMELGWPKKWFLWVAGGKYGGDLKIDSGKLGQSLVVDFVLVAVVWRLARLATEKWGAKTVGAGLVIIGVLGLIAVLLRSDDVQLRMKPPFPLNEKGAKYRITLLSAGTEYYLGEGGDVAKYSASYVLEYFPLVSNHLPERVLIYKYPENLGGFVTDEEGVEWIRVAGRFRRETRADRCFEFPCRKFKATGIDIYPSHSSLKLQS